MHFHFAGRVSAQPRPVLHQHHARAVPRGRERRAHTGKPSAGDQHVAIEIHLAHVPFACRELRARRSDPLEIGTSGEWRRRCILRIGRIGQHNQRVTAQPAAREKIAPVHVFSMHRAGAQAGS
jgi:hypothetical protein